MSCIDVTLPPQPKSGKQLLVVACALIDSDGRVLLAKRPAGKSMAGLWEFPGRKIQEKETPEDALCRELKEELGIATSPACLFPISFASHAYAEFHLLMPLYGCRNWQGVVKPQEGQEIIWVTSDGLGDYPMPPADVPLVSALRNVL